MLIAREQEAGGGAGVRGYALGGGGGNLLLLPDGNSILLQGGRENGPEFASCHE